MDHPLLHPTQKEKRQRVVTHLRQAYNIRKNSNIIFVCGGNESTHLRMKFIDYCKEKQKELQIFLPEYAMSSILRSDVEEQFDLAEFEETVADLSHSIVIFPEAPGSWAETGYFSAVERVAKSCILALNSDHQSDSFILLGPALRIERSTIFRPNIQLNYEAPSFDGIINKIKSRNFSDAKKKFVIDDIAKKAYPLRSGLTTFSGLTRGGVGCGLDFAHDQPLEERSPALPASVHGHVP